MSGEQAMAAVGAAAFALWAAYSLYVAATTGTIWIPAGRYASGDGGWVSFADHPSPAGLALAAYVGVAAAFAYIAQRLGR